MTTVVVVVLITVFRNSRVLGGNASGLTFSSSSYSTSSAAKPTKQHHAAHTWIELFGEGGGGCGSLSYGSGAVTQAQFIVSHTRVDLDAQFFRLLAQPADQGGQRDHIVAFVVELGRQQEVGHLNRAWE